MTPATLESCADVFVALADPSRRVLLQRLALDGPQSASTLATDMPISRQAVIKHLANLTDAELVKSQRAGREVLFVAQPKRLRVTAEMLEQVGDVLVFEAAFTEGCHRGYGRRIYLTNHGLASGVRYSAPGHRCSRQRLCAGDQIGHGDSLIGAMDTPGWIANSPDQAILTERKPEIRIANERRYRDRRCMTCRGLHRRLDCINDRVIVRQIDRLLDPRCIAGRVERQIERWPMFPQPVIRLSHAIERRPNLGHDLVARANRD